MLEFKDRNNNVHKHPSFGSVANNMLIEAIYLEDPLKIKKALEEGADINASEQTYGDMKKTPLAIAAQYEAVDIVEHLIKLGADPFSHIAKKGTYNTIFSNLCNEVGGDEMKKKLITLILMHSKLHADIVYQAIPKIDKNDLSKCRPEERELFAIGLAQPFERFRSAIINAKNSLSQNNANDPQITRLNDCEKALNIRFNEVLGIDYQNSLNSVRRVFSITTHLLTSTCTLSTMPMMISIPLNCLLLANLVYNQPANNMYFDEYLKRPYEFKSASMHLAMFATSCLILPAVISSPVAIGISFMSIANVFFNKGNIPFYKATSQVDNTETLVTIIKRDIVVTNSLIKNGFKNLLESRSIESIPILNEHSAVLSV